MKGKKYLITGIADANSLAMFVARGIQAAGGEVVCAGLGPTQFHTELSPKAQQFLEGNYGDFCAAVAGELGADVPTFRLDVSLPESIRFLAEQLAEKEIRLDGFLHAIAMDKTIRKKEVKPLWQVSATEYAETQNVSAYSLIALTQAFMQKGILNKGASVVASSYVAADRTVFHPYKNIAIAKGSLERIAVELASELGEEFAYRFNSVRFSPYMGSKAGGATLRQSDFDQSNHVSPLGNALPEDFAAEVVHLLQPNLRITGEIRHVDGGYNKLG